MKVHELVSILRELPQHYDVSLQSPTENEDGLIECPEIKGYSIQNYTGQGNDGGVTLMAEDGRFDHRPLRKQQQEDVPA